jgi:hypothetical protein
MTDRESRERLIELIGAVQSMGVKYTHEETASSMGFRGNAELADHLIASGVVVLKQGVWKDNNNGTFTCSVCGGRASKMSYCGNCGAKLKERE